MNRGARAARPLPDAALHLLDRFSDDVQELVLSLRARVLDVVPRATEVVGDVGYTVSLRYGPDARANRQVVYITGFARHANLGFIDGTGLSDPAGMLEGDGARMRHVKFRTVDAVAAASWFDAYLVAALDHAGLDAGIGDGQTIVRPRPN
jgi:hypothetical protein